MILSDMALKDYVLVDIRRYSNLENLFLVAKRAVAAGTQKSTDKMRKRGSYCWPKSVKINVKIKNGLFAGFSPKIIFLHP
jgi:hypothetical protein